MRQDEPWNWQFELQSAFAFIPTVRQPRELVRFVEGEVLKIYGAEAYLKRLSITLQDGDLDDPALSTILSVQEKVLANKAFVPHFVSTGVLRALCVILERENGRENPVPGFQSSIAESTLYILRFVYPDTSKAGERLIYRCTAGPPRRWQSLTVLLCSYASTTSSILSRGTSSNSRKR